MVRFILKLNLVFLLSVMTGCKAGWFRDRAGDYADEARPNQSLKMPASIKTESFSEDYQIPND